MEKCSQPVGERLQQQASVHQNIQLCSTFNGSIYESLIMNAEETKKRLEVKMHVCVLHCSLLSVPGLASRLYNNACVFVSVHLYVSFQHGGTDIYLLCSDMCF